MPPLGRPCIFCGAKADSHEHAIPKWIGKRFEMRAVTLHPISLLNVKPRKQPVRFGSHRERIFCKGCNAHFKHLEDEAIPIVEWMARGKSIILGQAEQDVLARWGAKTGYALIAAEREFQQLVPTEHTYQLREHDTVHALTYVAYASWGGHAHKFAGDHSVQTLEGRPMGVQAYGAILTFAQLALKVFGLSETVPGHDLLYDEDSLKQVFPRLDRQIAWPLWPAAQDGNIRALAILPPLTPQGH